MKILVDNSLLDMVIPATYCNFQISVLDKNTTPVYDAFDISNPDIYIGDLNNLTSSVVKNIEERPALRIFMVGSDKTDLFKKLEQSIGPFPYCNYVDYANVIKYGKVDYNPNFKTDIVAIEESPIENIEKTYFPIDITYRIFSNCRFVNHNNYCGLLVDNLIGPTLKSSKCSIVNERNVLNSILCDCFPVIEPEKAIEALNTDNSAAIKEVKEQILNSRTNFHAVADIFSQIGLYTEANFVLEKLKELL